MSHQGSSPQTGQRGYSAGAVGVLVFAAVLMILGGLFQAVEGMVAIANDEFFVKTEKWLFKFDATTWGWIHLLLGIVIVLAGIALFRGAVWARTVAVVLASLSIVTNFLWLPYYPWWSLTVITFGVFVIWAATVHGRDIAES